MELRHLRYFVAVAEELNFRRAATRLFMEQPPLSRQIQDLEREVGVILLRRVKRRVELTEAGTAFLQEAKATLLQADRAIETARRIDRGDAGKLTIGFSVNALQSALPETLQAYRQAYPKVDVSLSELCSPNQIKGLESGELDLGFVHHAPELPWLRKRHLERETLVAVLPETHPLAAQETIPLADLAQERFLLFPAYQHPALHEDILTFCQQAGFTPNAIQEATPPRMLLSLVEAGSGISLVPISLQAVARPGLVFRKLDRVAPTIDLFIVWSETNRSQAVSRFLEMVPHPSS